jgi:hypothetical protein
MIDYLARKEVLHEAFFKKYAAKKYMKASIIVRDWIHSQYTEEEVTTITTETKTELIEFEDPEKENAPDDTTEDLDNESENENAPSEEDDYMYADQLEEREIDVDGFRG